jgi:mycofactocin glycosyltransferase
VIAVVVESWNAHGDARPLERVLAALSPQLGSQLDGAELVVTHAGPMPRERLERAAGRAITWACVPRDAGYYEHKNRGFAATDADIVAFVDGDCTPRSGWLEALTEPIAARRARVVAGSTAYAGLLAPLATRLDFPSFVRDRGRGTVRNFFANNVAFARTAFTGYPDLPMFHGQCQVLALQLAAAGIAIHAAPGARVTHAWPGSAREWLAVRFLRGADTVALIPYIARHHAPRVAPLVAWLGPAPALAVLGARAVMGTWTALRHGPRLRGLALVAGVTLADALGAAAGPIVYRLSGAVARSPSRAQLPTPVARLA